MTLQINPDDIDAVVRILSDHAGDPLQGTPQDYFQDLVASAHLPRMWTRSIAGRWTGNANRDARRLVDWAITQKINPEDPRYTAIGAVLRALIAQTLSPDEARTVVAVIVFYGLILNKELLDEIKVRYAVPLPPSTPVAAAASYGPDFDWRGPSSDLELQSFFRPEPAWLDVGFLRRAMARSASVCRIEIGPIRGTGFLVAPALVLTNYHVLKGDPADDIQANAGKAILRFSCFTTETADPSEGLAFKLASGGILEQSPVEERDFVLLKVEDKILAEESIQPAAIELTAPAERSALNILHHPGGDTMKLSTSGNGVTGVYEGRGLIQYVTSAVEGSSGSPCFNEDWKVVALHHAQRSRAWGSVREGILMRDIQARINKHF